jgi:hypothetical protein
MNRTSIVTSLTYAQGQLDANRAGEGGSRVRSRLDVGLARAGQRQRTPGGRLTTEVELEAISLAAAGACDDAETVARDLRALIDDWQQDAIAPSAAPSFADLGRLWAFADALETAAIQCADQAAEIRGSLGDLNCMRRDIAVRNLSIRGATAWEGAFNADAERTQRGEPSLRRLSL